SLYFTARDLQDGWGGIWFHSGNFQWNSDTEFKPIPDLQGGFVTVSAPIHIQTADVHVHNTAFNLATGSLTGSGMIRFLDASHLYWQDGTVTGINILIQTLSTADIGVYAGNNIQLKNAELTSGGTVNIGNKVVGNP